MPRRPANVNQSDVQRILRACKREEVQMRITLQPNGSAVFEPLPSDGVIERSPLDTWRSERGAS